MTKKNAAKVLAQYLVWKMGGASPFPDMAEVQTALVIAVKELDGDGWKLQGKPNKEEQSHFSIVDRNGCFDIKIDGSYTGLGGCNKRKTVTLKNDICKIYNSVLEN